MIFMKLALLPAMVGSLKASLREEDSPEAVVQSSGEAVALTSLTSTSPSVEKAQEDAAKQYYQATALVLLEEAVKILLDRVIYLKRIEMVKKELNADIQQVAERIRKLEELKSTAADEITKCEGKWRELLGR